MFDMVQIGKRVAELRKSKNMTQVELADQLGISYQAVSNWETGNSMPDIAKLEDLSNIFDVSIDELLGNAARAKVVKEIMNKEKINVNDMDEEAVKDVLPLIKPSDIEDSFETDTLSIQHLLTFAPFLDTEVLDEMIRDTYEIGNINFLTGLAPFCSETLIDELVMKELDEGDIESSQHVIALAPFLSQSTVDVLALSVYEANGVKAIVPFAPFATESIIQRIVEHELQEKHFKEVIPLLPFAGKSDILKDVMKKNFKDYFKKKEENE